MPAKWMITASPDVAIYSVAGERETVEPERYTLTVPVAGRSLVKSLMEIGCGCRTGCWGRLRGTRQTVMRLPT